MKMVKCWRKNVSLSSFWVGRHDGQASDFYASSLQAGEGALPLLLARLGQSALTVSFLAWSVTSSPSPYWLIYLTNWGLLLLTSMTLSGLLVSVMAVCNQFRDCSGLPWYVSMYWLLHNVAVSIAIMITVLYWTLIYDANATEEPVSKPAFWLDVATHAFNSCIAVSELLLTRTPVSYLHLYQPAGLGLWYAAFSGIYYLAGGTDAKGMPYIYAVLDWRQTAVTALVVAGSFAGLVIIYTGVWAAARARDRLSDACIRTKGHDLPYVAPDNGPPAVV
ncbi:hypothetical protein JYU34_003255 [Plutella xylostella]|uniref:Protein rolling stone-like n=1 Tax=Plutella xylostella TaxID=51655 RepID=A0ABQ7QZK2_PLUXY|nr:hypothetical protein JYU34_003255 [Plutella xylostella]